MDIGRATCRVELVPVRGANNPIQRNPCMALTALPLSYCTNLHPGRSLAEVEQALDHYTVPVRAGFGEPLAAGLWLAAPVVRELLAAPPNLAGFRDRLTRRGLVCHTLNAFPYGDFHSPRVKENVYLPDWADRKRIEYTLDCARVLAALLPGGADGSISTLPLAFKGFPHPPDHLDWCLAHLLELALALDRLHQETGRTIRLAIEPEPLCLLETTAETLVFFNRLGQHAADAKLADQVRRHIGVCYDVCHQAVEFEDVAGSIRALAAAGVRINKVHVTCALRLSEPAENVAARQALAAYVEERYLHQTLARTRQGSVLREVDLTRDLALEPPAEFREATEWRVHFHVPVDADRLGPLTTTRDDLVAALATVAGLDYAPHLEIETYTWEVLPDAPAGRSDERIIAGLIGELRATRALVDTLKPPGE
ncbi:MAG: metabolite traffic protein EboE [Planctomycetaceae bacterium]